MVGQLVKRPGQPCLRVYAVQLSGFGQGVGDASQRAAKRGSTEEGQQVMLFHLWADDVDHLLRVIDIARGIGGFWTGAHLDRSLGFWFAMPDA